MTDIPPESISLVLKRYDLTTFDDTGIIIGNIVKINGRTSGNITVYDTNLKQGHIYKYQCVIINKFGKETVGSNELIIEYKPIVSNIINTTITNPIITTNNNSE